MTQDELTLVLEALKWCHGGEPCGTAEAIAVVEKALAQTQEPHALQGLAAYLRCEAGGVFVGSPSHDALLQWAREVDAAKAQQEPKQEPVAWRTFDGEGGYDYRSYEDNESYADDWDKRNPNHKGWVEPLYTTSQKRTWVGLTVEEVEKIWQGVEASDFHDCVQPFAQAIENILKDKNCVG